MEGEDRKSNIVKATPGDEGEDAVISVKLAPQDGSVRSAMMIYPPPPNF